MKPSQPVRATGTCSRCGECCRWLPFASVRQCKPHQLHYLRERGLRESDGYFLINAPCRHLWREAPDGSGMIKWSCAIYDTRPATCRDFCGKVLSGGKRFYVPGVARWRLIGAKDRFRTRRILMVSDIFSPSPIVFIPSR